MKPGSLTMIVGPVGSGKSSILKTLVNEMHILKGSALLNGRVSYVPQEPFLLNDLLRNNILFGNDFDQQKYSKVLSICELGPDIQSLKGGEFAEIGEKGINLSGGQKQRISLARALYQEADVYLIDDSLSALDPHVGRKIFENVIIKQLVQNGKTVVLTTHVLTFLSQADQVVFLEKGRIEGKGRFEEIKERNQKFKEFIQEDEIKRRKQSGQYNDANQSVSNKGVFDYDPKIFDEFTPDLRYEDAQSVYEHSSLHESRREYFPQVPEQPDLAAQLKKAQTIQGRLTKAERKEKGKVKGNIFWTYFTSGGTCFFLVIILFFILSILFNIGADYWVSVWTSAKFGLSQSTYLNVYGLFLGLMILSVALKGVLFGWYTLKIGLSLFDSVLAKIVKKPMLFFDVTPSGQLLNLTGKDADFVDERIGVHSSMTIDGMLRLVGILVLSGVANFLLIPAVIRRVFFRPFSKFTVANLQCSSSEATTRSPCT